MSDYCQGCRYSPTERTGESACPYNFLFWTFLDLHRRSFRSNPRIAMMLKNLDRIDGQELADMHTHRRKFVELTIPAGRKKG